MAYITLNDILQEIAGPDLIAALDDGDMADLIPPGTLDTVRLGYIMNTASAEVDSYLAAAYTVPLSAYSPVAYNAALMFACEKIMNRRLTPPNKNIFSERAGSYRATLKKIQEDGYGLDASIPRAYPPGVANTCWMETNGTSA
jgi:phage gp36-like protein